MKSSLGNLNIEEISEKIQSVEIDSLTSLNDVLPLMLRYAMNDSLSKIISLRICLFNSMISATKMMQLHLLQKYARAIVGPMVHVFKDKKSETVLRSASLQVRKYKFEKNLRYRLGVVHNCISFNC